MDDTIQLSKQVDDLQRSVRDLTVAFDPENPSANFQQLINPVIGATGSKTVSNRGITLSAAFHIPLNADPRLKKTLDGLKDAIKRCCL